MEFVFSGTAMKLIQIALFSQKKKTKTKNSHKLEMLPTTVIQFIAVADVARRFCVSSTSSVPARLMPIPKEKRTTYRGRTTPGPSIHSHPNKIQVSKSKSKKSRQKVCSFFRAALFSLPYFHLHRPHLHHTHPPPA